MNITLGPSDKHGSSVNLLELLKLLYIRVRVEVFTVVKVVVFWIVTPRRLICRYKPFRETYCPSLDQNNIVTVVSKLLHIWDYFCILSNALNSLSYLRTVTLDYIWECASKS
jgi:hypothetical protein